MLFISKKYFLFCLVCLSLSACLQSHLLFNVHSLLRKEHPENPIFKTEVNKTKRRPKKVYYLESFDHKVGQSFTGIVSIAVLGETKDFNQEKFSASLQQFRLACSTQENLFQDGTCW